VSSGDITPSAEAAHAVAGTRRELLLTTRQLSTQLQHELSLSPTFRATEHESRLWLTPQKYRLEAASVV
jgi:hypothetical protein